MTLTKPTIGQLGGPSGWPSLINAAFDNIDANTAGLAAKVAKGDLVLNIKDYGAVGDGAANDTTAITNAIAAAVAGGGAVYVPPGTYKVTSALAVTTKTHMYGAGRGNSVIQSSTSDVLTVSQVHVHIEGISFKSLSGGGNVVVVPPSATAGTALAQSRFVGCEFNQANTGSYVWLHNDPSGLGGGMFDVHWEDCLFTHVTTATVPAFYVFTTAGNAFAANRFTRCRVQNSSATTWAFDIQCDCAGVYHYNNVWDSINFEVANGGGIRLFSALNTGIHNVGFFDNTTIVNDLIQFGRTATTPARSQSKSNVVSNYHRSGGTLSGGAVDIHLNNGENTQTTTILGVGGPTGAGITLDLGAGHATVLGYGGSVTINGTVAANTILMSSTAGTSTPLLSVNGVALTFSGGAVASVRTATSAVLASIGNAINTANKATGTMIFNTTTGKPVWSTGTTAASVWVDATGATAHTPV